MGRARYYNQAFTVDGVRVRIEPYASVTLFEEGTTDPIPSAEIFAADTGSTTLPNPFTADQYGNVLFFLDNSKRVKIRLTGPSLGTLDVDNELVDPDPDTMFLDASSGHHLNNLVVGGSTKVARKMEIIDSDFPFTNGVVPTVQSTLRVNLGGMTQAEEYEGYSTHNAISGLVSLPNDTNATEFNGSFNCITGKGRGNANTKNIVGMYSVVRRSGPGGTSVQTVTTSGAASGATSVPVTALAGPILKGTVLSFTGGKLATLTTSAQPGDTSLAVSALAAGLNNGDTATTTQASGLSGIWCFNGVWVDHGHTLNAPVGQPTGIIQELDAVISDEEGCIWVYDGIGGSGTAQGKLNGGLGSSYHNGRSMYNSVVYNVRGIGNYDPILGGPRLVKWWYGLSVQGNATVFGAQFGNQDDAVSNSVPVVFLPLLQSSPAVATLAMALALKNGHLALRSGGVLAGEEAIELQRYTQDTTVLGTAMAIATPTGFGIGTGLLASNLPITKLDAYMSAAGLQVVETLTNYSGGAGDGVALGFNASAGSEVRHKGKVGIGLERTNSNGVGALHFLMNTVNGDTTAISSFATHSIGRFAADKGFVVGASTVGSGGAGTIAAEQGFYGAWGRFSQYVQVEDSSSSGVLGLQYRLNRHSGVAGTAIGIGFGTAVSGEGTGLGHKAGIGLERGNSYGRGNLHFFMNNDANNNDVVMADSKAYLTAAGGWVLGSATGGDKGLGTINAKGYYDDNIAVTDFVFDLYYDKKMSEKDIEQFGQKRLWTIDEVREFTKIHRHLPTLPGREYVEKYGHKSLSEKISDLWETVEHLQLHIFELKDKISA